MHASNFHAVLAVLAATASAQSTRTATVLIPDWCVTQAQPTVTVLGQDDLTTYSYSCSVDSSAVSSASAHASGVYNSAMSKASAMRASAGVDPRVTDTPYYNDHNDRRSLNFLGKRDDTCYGWDSFEACIPWEITQGPSLWAVHYTVTGIVALDQECTFGAGGVSSGPATCTASGRLDPDVWGEGDGTHTHTFAKTDVDYYWIRNTVQVTAGGGAQPTNAQGTNAAGSTVTSATVPVGSGARASPAAAQSDGSVVQSTALGVSMPVPTAAVALAFGAGGIFAAALAL